MRLNSANVLLLLLFLLPAVSVAQSTSVESLSFLIPLTAIIGVLMGLLVVLANYFPAKKIIVLEPAEALRHE